MIQFKTRGEVEEIVQHYPIYNPDMYEVYPYTRRITYWDRDLRGVRVAFALDYRFEVGQLTGYCEYDYDAVLPHQLPSSVGVKLSCRQSDRVIRRESLIDFSCFVKNNDEVYKINANGLVKVESCWTIDRD